jgi:2-dehydropantoate 2-reductase
MGTGALGGYFGGRLAQAGADVSFIARGANLEALKRDGLKIESPRGDAHLPDIRASADPADIGPVDLVLFMVKLYDTEEAGRATAPLLGPNTTVLTLQNGVNAAQRLSDILGAEPILDGIAYIPADLRAPGIVRHNGEVARLVFGEAVGQTSPRCQAIRDAFQAAGVDVEIAPDINATLWQKFIMLSALSAITALTRLPIGAILADKQAAKLFRSAIEESVAVARAECPTLPDDAAEAALKLVATFPYGVRASMAEDLNRGKRLELMDLSGEITRRATAHAIPTPTHQVAVQALHPFVDGAPEGL